MLKTKYAITVITLIKNSILPKTFITSIRVHNNIRVMFYKTAAVY